MTADRSSRAGSPDTGEPEGAEKITIKDNRRIDRSTGRARSTSPSGAAAQSGPAAQQSGSGDPGSGDPNSANPADAANIAANSGEVEAARAEAAERTADLQRLSAEYANYRKRVERDKQAAKESGKAAVVAELLGVCDDLDRAEEHGDLVGGFKNVADKFTGILQRLGLNHYGAAGDEFDPTIHEAVQFATSPEVDRPTVTTVLRLGYLFEEKVLRPAVVVVTGPEDDVAGDTEEMSNGQIDGTGEGPAA